jgi:hypothetical protein
VRVLLLSRDERNAFLLHRLQQEGNDVMLLTNQGMGSWSGLIERATSPQQAAAWKPDVVLVDSPGFGPVLKRFAEMGFPIIGGSGFHDRVERDFMLGMSLLDTVGVPTTEYHDFSDISTASEYVHGKHHPWRMVFPNRTSEGFPDDVALQYRMEEMVANQNMPPRFALTRDFPSMNGNSMTLRSQFIMVGMMGAKGLMNPVMALQISNNLLDDDQGIMTQEGCTLVPMPMSHPLVALTLSRLSLSLLNLNYRGPVFLDCVTEPPMNENEWQGRVCVHNFGMTVPDGFWAAFIRGLEMTFEWFLDRLLNPRSHPTPFEFFQGVVSARKISVPPYPLTEAPWLSQEARESLLKMMPPVKLPFESGAVYWNGIRRNGSDSTVELVHPVIGYLTGRAGDYQGSLEQIRSEAEQIRIPYAQVKTSPDRTFEVDMLPVELARFQLKEDDDMDMAEVVHG